MEKDQRKDEPPKEEKPGVKEQKEAAKQQPEGPANLRVESSAPVRRGALHHPSRVSGGSLYQLRLQSSVTRKADICRFQPKGNGMLWFAEGPFQGPPDSFLRLVGELPRIRRQRRGSLLLQEHKEVVTGQASTP
jgi:hypothetical protein